jgi:hypothetical protein
MHLQHSVKVQQDIIFLTHVLVSTCGGKLCGRPEISWQRMGPTRSQFLITNYAISTSPLYVVVGMVIYLVLVLQLLVSTSRQKLLTLRVLRTLRTFSPKKSLCMLLSISFKALSYLYGDFEVLGILCMQKMSGRALTIFTPTQPQRDSDTPKYQS